MNLRFQNGVSAACLIGLLSSCASVSTLQTARALRENSSRIIFGGGYYKSDLKTNAGDALQFPLLEGAFRLGLGSGFEVGAKYTMPGTLTGDFKWQFVDSEKFAMATGLGASYLAMGSNSNTSSGSNNRFTYNFLQIDLPLYLSYDFSPSFSGYLSPRYLQRFVSGELMQGSSSSQLLGGGAGLKLGKTDGVFLEVSYFKGLNGFPDQLQGGIAVFLGVGKPSHEPTKKSTKLPVKETTPEVW